MRPVRTIIAVAFAAAVAITGCAANSSADDPSAVPAPPVVDQAPAPNPAPKPPTPPNPPTEPNIVVDRPPPPVLADGRYDAYLRKVDVPIESGTSRTVVDLVKVFHGQAAVEAAIADGKPRAAAQYLDVYIRNRNPRLRTLPLADDVRLDLVGRRDCGAGSAFIHDIGVLIGDVNQQSPHLYFTLTVTGGAVRHIKEVPTQPAC
jgi:hypothetical protein